MISLIEVLTYATTLLGLYLTFYAITYFGLMKMNHGFKALEKDRRMYIVKNYVKSFVLGSGAYFAMRQAYKILYDTSALNTTEITINSLAYVLTDTLGLLLVRGLQTNTKMHHTVTNMLGVYVITSVFQQKSLAYLPMLYAAFSSLSFIVNFYLAFRAHTNRPVARYWLSRISLVVYIIATFGNWFTQLSYILMLRSENIFVMPDLYSPIRDSYWFPLFYMPLLCIIVYDDIVLMTWLKKDFDRRALKAATENNAIKLSDNDIKKD